MPDELEKSAEAAAPKKRDDAIKCFSWTTVNKHNSS